MKLNNTGFAITTILYGTLILFLMLFLSLLGILSQYKSNLEKLVENNNGGRSIVTMEPITVATDTAVEKKGYYHIGNTCYKYLQAGEKAKCVK